jgi:predicted nucleic acid-binding protein
MDVLAAQGQRLVIVPQNLYEFWAVATRKSGLPPAGQNGLGMTPDQASLWLRYFQRRFTLLPDREELFPHWHDLVRTLGVTGLKSHDARLVASMQCHGITQLLTFNADDFKRFAITVIDPASL